LDEDTSDGSQTGGEESKVPLSGFDLGPGSPAVDELRSYRIWLLKSNSISVVSSLILAQWLLEIYRVLPPTWTLR
jgi:hypothetical protein